MIHHHFNSSNHGQLETITVSALNGTPWANLVFGQSEHFTSLGGKWCRSSSLSLTSLITCLVDHIYIQGQRTSYKKSQIL